MQLLGFCMKNKPLESKESSVNEEENGAESERSKRIEEAMSKGKLIEAGKKHF